MQYMNDVRNTSHTSSLTAKADNDFCFYSGDDPDQSILHARRPVITEMLMRVRFRTQGISPKLSRNFRPGHPHQGSLARETARLG